MLSERTITGIRSMPEKLKRPVRLILFTSDTGCAACPDMLELARAIKKRCTMTALETYDVVMDRDKSTLYGVKRAPALVVQSGEGEKITFYGMLEDLFLDLLLSTIVAVAESKVWFSDSVRRALKHLENDVPIQVFVESDCAQCRPVAETAVGLSFQSKLIDASIIMASDFPDLVRHYGISTLPTTVLGENQYINGHVPVSEFLETVFHAEGLKTGPEKKCLVCGKSSPDNICSNCKLRIQAEVVEHKFKGEKLGHPNSL